MELAALGTPDMPLNKVRVPRQAATAAKAAIKKDLLMQNSRPGAASVPSKTVPSSSAVKSASSKIQKKQARVRLFFFCSQVKLVWRHAVLLCDTRFFAFGQL